MATLHPNICFVFVSSAPDKDLLGLLRFYTSKKGTPKDLHWPVNIVDQDISYDSFNDLCLNFHFQRGPAQNRPACSACSASIMHLYQFASTRLVCETNRRETRYSARTSHARVYLLACYDWPGDEATQLGSCAAAEKHAFSVAIAERQRLLSSRSC